MAKVVAPAAKMKPEVVEEWRKALHKAAEGLDLTDPEDRAIYRGRVEHDARYATVGAINGVLFALTGRKAAGRARALRALTALKIEGAL